MGLSARTTTKGANHELPRERIMNYEMRKYDQNRSQLVVQREAGARWEVVLVGTHGEIVNTFEGLLCRSKVA